MVPMQTLEILILADGDVRMIYNESIDLRCLGQPQIRRGSHVEPTSDGRWTADLSPVGGPQLGPFDHRSAAIAAEIAWLAEHWLSRVAGQ
jgi:hypothetical protein